MSMGHPLGKDAARISRRSFLHRVGTVGAAFSGLNLLSREGVADQGLLWYSASASSADEDWSRMFREKTGVSVEYFRIGGVKLTERIEQEARAGQVRCSVMDISIPGLMSTWARKGMLLQYDSPESAHYPVHLRMP